MSKVSKLSAIYDGYCRFVDVSARLGELESLLRQIESAGTTSGVDSQEMISLAETLYHNADEFGDVVNASMRVYDKMVKWEREENSGQGK